MTPAAMRPIKPIACPDVTPGGDITGVPQFRMVDPATLLVDETYQRDLSERSIRLIRRIIADWSWCAFKPPVVVETADGLHVIDGQHTAIAAASHPGVPEIPVMIIHAEAIAQRAEAFVRHNRDRLQVTSTQLHFAMVAAGNEDAVTVQQVCDRAGARILKHPPSYAVFKPGDTMAVQALHVLVGRRYAKGAREVVQTCVEGKLAPITAGVLKAVEVLLFDPEYKGQVAPEDIATTLREMGGNAEREAKVFAAEHNVPQWRALVAVLFRKTRKVRHGHRAAA